PWPGATRSGFASPSIQVGPRELYTGIVSSPRPTVPCVLSAPTVIADGALPGDVMPPYAARRVDGLRPLLPAATTTMIPASVAFCTASTRGSGAADSKIG